MPDMPNTDVVAGLGLTDTGVQTLSTATALLGNIKTLLYDLSKNPLIASYGALKLEDQMGRLVQMLKKLKEEAKENNTQFGMLGQTLTNPRFWVGFGGLVTSIGLRIRGLRDEIEKTQLAMYRVTGKTGPVGYGDALGLQRNQAGMQMTYGREFADQYRRVVEQVQQRLIRQGTPASQQGKMFEILTGLSMATGVDYGKAVNRVQDAFSHYNVTTEEAAAATDLVRDAWNRGDTAIGNLNDNIEVGSELLQEYAKRGMSLKDAAAAMQETMRAASQLGVTTQGMMEMQAQTNRFAEFGPQGVQNRLKLVAGMQVFGANKQMQNLLGKYGGRPEEALFGMQMTPEGQADFAKFMQQYARQVLPMNQEGKVDLGRLKGNESQYRRAFGAAGLDLQTMLRYAQGEDVTGKKGGVSPEKEFKDKLVDITDRSLMQFDTSLQNMIETAGTWQDAMEGWLKKSGLDTFGNISSMFINIITAMGGLMMGLGMMRSAFGGGGGGVTGVGGMFGGGFTSSITGAGGNAGRWAGMGGGMLRGAGIAASSAASAYFAQQSLSQGKYAQGGLEAASTLVPGGGLAVAGGRAAGALYSWLASKVVGNDAGTQFRPEEYQRFLDAAEDYEKRGYKTQAKEERMAAEAYKKQTTAADESNEEKYSLQSAMKRAFTGETLEGSGVNVGVNVYVDSEQIASRVESRVNHGRQQESNNNATGGG